MTTVLKRPLRAAKCPDHSVLKFPLIGTPKLDGIRCLIVGTRPLSRTLKIIPNLQVQKFFHALPTLHGLDGELLAVDENENLLPYNDVQSLIMTASANVNFRYYAFDVWNSDLGYADRMKIVSSLCDNQIVIDVGLQSSFISSYEQMVQYEEKCLDLGYEGIMLRDPNGPYKQGTSTLKEQTLIKIKRFEDDEMIITGFTELMHNNNEAVVDALGLTKRSSHKDNLVSSGMMGVMHGLCKGVEVSIGTGFTEFQRRLFWANQSDYIGKYAKFSYQPSGAKNKYRFTSFIGFRDAIDL